MLNLCMQDCNASVLLVGWGTKRIAPPNASLEGFSGIDIIKVELERLCRCTVLCIDILASVVPDSKTERRAILHSACWMSQRSCFINGQSHCWVIHGQHECGSADGQLCQGRAEPRQNNHSNLAVTRSKRWFASISMTESITTLVHC